MTTPEDDQSGTDPTQESVEVENTMVDWGDSDLQTGGLTDTGADTRRDQS